jgi:integrase
MASIQRIKSPLTGAVTYRVQVRVKNRPTESKTFTNRKDAEQWGSGLENAISDGKYFPSRTAARTTFAQLVKRYRENGLDQLKLACRAPRDAQLTWWEGRFGTLTLAEITPDKVAEARDALAAETFTRGKDHKNNKTGVVTLAKQYKRSGATCNRYLAALSHLFSMAIREWRLLDRNPVHNIKKKKETRGRIRFLSDVERDTLLAACANSGWPALHTLVLLAISTGARRGELIALRWSDIDLKVQRAEGDPAMGRATVRDSKNGEPRVLPLVGKALEAVRALKLQGSAKSEWVFPQPSGIEGAYENFDAHWYAALVAAGIKDFKFHDLRHTCASYLASQGASLLEIADTLGHRGLQMVRRYSHLAQSHKVSVIERMAKAKGL